MGEAEKQYHRLLPKYNHAFVPFFLWGTSIRSFSYSSHSSLVFTNGRDRRKVRKLPLYRVPYFLPRQAVFDHSSEFYNYLTVFSPVRVCQEEKQRPITSNLCAVTFMLYFKQASSFSQSFLACWYLSVKVAGKQYHRQYHSLLQKNNHTFVPYFLRGSKIRSFSHSSHCLLVFTYGRDTGKVRQLPLYLVPYFLPRQAVFDHSSEFYNYLTVFSPVRVCQEEKQSLQS